MFGWLRDLWTAFKAVRKKDDPIAGGSLPGVRGPDPRPYLSGAAPGAWSSNHLAEAVNAKGWQYVAVQALSRMCSQAEVAVHHVGGKAQQRRALRAARLARLAGDVRGEKRYKALAARLGQLSPPLQLRKDQAPTPTGTRPDRHPAGPNHPLLRLLQKPNPNWSGQLFLFAAVQQLGYTGSCYLWRVRNGAGAPVELYVLPTGLLIPRLPSPEFPEGSYWLTPLAAWGLNVPEGDPWAPGTLGTALLTGAEIDRRDVRAVRWPHPVYLSDGLSPQQAGALWVDVSNEMDRSNWYLLQNGERPGMIFSQEAAIDPDPADVAQWREDLRADHSGSTNTGKHLVLPKGVSGVPRANAPVDMDYANGRTQYRDMQLALHAVSPISAGITEAGNYGAFWAAMKQTTELAVSPILGLLAGELTEFLGGDFQGPRSEVGLTARAIDDPQLLENRLGTDIAAGNVLLVKEYRALRGLAPLGDERDEEFVGVKKSIRAQDDPEREGVQAGGKDGDKVGGDRGTGTRQPTRDRPAGRQDGNGKARNGRRKFNPDQPRVPAGSPEGGEWTTGGGRGGGGATVPASLAEKSDLGHLSHEEAAAVSGALDRLLTAGGHKFKLRSLQVVEKSPSGRDEGGLGYSNGNVYVMTKFLEQARDNDPEQVKEQMAGTGAERNVSWQDARGAEAIVIAVAHEVGHHVANALLLDLMKAARETKDAGHDLSEATLVKLSGYASTHVEELFAEAHAFMSTGREHKIPEPVREFYRRALATADPEPIPQFMRGKDGNGKAGRNGHARPFGASKFDPSEPRVPAGQPGGGEWTSGGGEGGRPAPESRGGARSDRRDRLDRAEELASGGLAEGLAAAAGKVRDAEGAGAVASAVKDYRGAEAPLREAVAAGLEGRAKDRWEKLLAAQDARLDRKAEAASRAHEKAAAARKALAEHEAAEPEEPEAPAADAYPDEPRRPEEPDDPGSPEYERWEAEVGRLDDEYQAAVDRIDDGYAAALDRWEAAHGRWEAKFDRLTGAAESAEEKASDATDALLETLEDRDQALSDAAADLIWEARGAIDDEEAAGEYPEGGYYYEGNGKRLRNGRRKYDPSEPRDDRGRWTRQEAEESDLADRHEAEHDRARKAAEREDRALGKERDREDAKLARAREREDGRLDAAREREDERFGARWQKEYDRKFDALDAEKEAGRLSEQEHAEKEAALIRERDQSEEDYYEQKKAERAREDAEIRARRDAEDEERRARREREDAARAARREAEGDALSARHAAEREALWARHAGEDEAADRPGKAHTNGRAT